MESSQHRSLIAVLRGGFEKAGYRAIAGAYLIVFLVIMVAFNLLQSVPIIGEFDDYTLPVASLLSGNHLSVYPEDVVRYKEIFPELAGPIDRFYDLSSYTTAGGGQLPFYFPYYAMYCLPFVLALRALGITASMAFPLANLTALMLCLVVAWHFTRISDGRKLLLVVLLSLNPIVFYVAWMGAEVLIYSLIVAAVVFWHERRYRPAAVFLAFAGAMNPTILIVGVVMTAEALVHHALKKPQAFSKGAAAVRAGQYLLCYLPVLVVFAYNLHHIGHLNVVSSTGASASLLSGGLVGVFERFVAYLFDLNFGFLPYYTLLLLAGFALLVVSLLRRKALCCFILVSFFALMLGYSVMAHINCGMSGIARYNAWSAPLMLFAIAAYWDLLAPGAAAKRCFKAALAVSLVWMGGVIWMYGVWIAQHTSYTRMTPIAEAVFDTAPELYNPLDSTFNSRVTHVDGGYNDEESAAMGRPSSYETPIVYCNGEGYARKVLANGGDYATLDELYYGTGKELLLEQASLLADEDSYISLPPSTEVARYEGYRLGSPISFEPGSGLNASSYVCKGLSWVPGDGFYWSNGDEIIVRMKLKGQATPQKGTLGLMGTYEGAPHALSVTVNGEYAGEYAVQAEGPSFVEFPVTCQDDRLVEIRIRIEDYQAPAWHIPKADEFTPAIALSSLRVS